MYFAYGTLTLYGQPFHTVPLYMNFLTSREICKFPKQDPTTPHMQRLQAYTHRVWAVPRSLAATYGISIDLLS